MASGRSVCRWVRTSSHAQAPSQWPAIRTVVGVLVVVMPRLLQGLWTTACHYLCHEFVEVRTVKRVERLHALSEMLRRSGARGVTAERLRSEERRVGKEGKGRSYV